jgi:putative transposase
MKTTTQQRRDIVDKAHKKLSVKEQCYLMSIHRSGYYYQHKSESKLNLELMALIDKQYMDHPYMGVPAMTQWLNKDMGYSVNKKRVRRLYKLLDISAIVPGPHTSRGNKEHKKYPYLLRNLEITRPNQAWGIDITYIPIKNGFMYLVAIIDLYSRYVVGWSLSNSMDAEWCKETVEKAIEQHGKPEIINSDQGSQFTSEIFTEFLLQRQINISMDGKGRAIDNIFIERLWRSVKYEDVYLKAYSTAIELRTGIKAYFEYYNHHRRHSSIDYKKPVEVFQAA